MKIDKIAEFLGSDKSFLEYKCKGIDKSSLHLPGPDFIDRVWVASDRPINVLKNLHWLFQCKDIIWVQELYFLRLTNRNWRYLS